MCIFRPRMNDFHKSFLLSFITPVVKRGPEAASSAAAPHRAGAAQQACTPLSHTAGFHTPQVQHCYRPVIDVSTCSLDLLFSSQPKSLANKTEISLELICFSMKVSFSSFSNESITIKGKQFFILKMIGRGGSSKVKQHGRQQKTQTTSNQSCSVLTRGAPINRL